MSLLENLRKIDLVTETDLELDAALGLDSSTMIDKKRAINLLIFFVFLLAVALSFYSLPNDTDWRKLADIKIILAAFSFEGARAAVMVVNVMIARVSGHGLVNRLMPLSIFACSFALAYWNHHALTVVHGEDQGNDYLTYAIIVGCNWVIFSAELAITFLLTNQAERYAAIKARLASISEQLASIKEPIANISAHLRLKAGVYHSYPEILRKTIAALKLCSKQGEIHTANLATIKGKVLSIKEKGASHAVRALVCSKGMITPLGSNAQKTATCACCGEQLTTE